MKKSLAHLFLGMESLLTPNSGIGRLALLLRAYGC